MTITVAGWYNSWDNHLTFFSDNRNLIQSDLPMYTYWFKTGEYVGDVSITI